MPDWSVVEITDWHGNDVVAVDHARFGQTVFGTNLYLGADSSDRASDRGTGDRREHRDRRITSQHADRPSARRRPEIGPENIVAGYHAGTVFAASRRAARTNAGSAGCR